MGDFEEGPFGDLLARYRTQTRTSQQKLATCLGVTRTTVVKWEQKGSLPKDRTRIEEIVRCLQLTEQQREALLRAALFDTSHDIWNVPYRRNPHFTGREELLDRLTKQLSPVGHDDPTTIRQAALTQPQAIKGLGGVGKTQIAVEYAYRLQEQGRYTHTFWINAASEEALITSFIGLAQLLPSFSAKNEKDQGKLVVAVKRWVEQCKQPWLLIVDNVEDISLMREYLPQRGNGSIVLTTRMDAVGSLATPIEVETMGFVEGTQLLLRRARRFEHVSDEEINEASNIVVALGHFPLALDQAGAYIEETKCHFADYLALYQTHRQKLLARRGRQATDYPDSVATTWSLSFQKVEQANPAAAELLRLCAFLAPDHIPEELITDGAAHWPPRLQQAATDGFTFNEMIEALLTFSLVKRLVEGQMLSIHRLVQAVQIDSMELGEQWQWATRVVLAVNEIFPHASQDAATWPQCLRYLEQAQACDALIQHHQLVHIEAADLLNRIGRYTFHHALYTLAEPLYQRALAIWEQQLGPVHPQVADPLNGLVNLYREQGKYKQAELYAQQALYIREQTLGPEHPKVAHILTNLAHLHNEQGKYEQAEPLYLRALSILEQAHGPEHSDVAETLKGLANLYLEQGKYEQAEPLYLRALSILEQAHGPEHPKIAETLNNLATLYLEQGKYEQAEPLYLRALSIREQSYGTEHHQVAFPLSGLALLHQAQGKHEQAKQFYLRALAIREYCLDSLHPHIAESLHDFADFQSAQGNKDEAAFLYQRALTIRELGLGAYHPKTVETREHFAALLRTMGRYNEVATLGGVYLELSQHERAKTKEDREAHLGE